MKRLKKYHDGNVYVTGGIASVEPNVNPVEEYDLSSLSNEEYQMFKENPKDKNLLKKARKIG